MNEELARQTSDDLADVALRWLLSVHDKQGPRVLDAAAWRLIGAVALVVADRRGYARMREMLADTIRAMSH